MARNMHVGETWEPLRGMAADESGSPVDLSTAEALEVILVSTGHTITGTPVSLHPPILDDDGVHQWNWQYNWVPTDTTNPGEYNVYLKVTWVVGEDEIYPDQTPDVLTILPLSAPGV